jgi:glycyl-tRNA synthetase
MKIDDISTYAAKLGFFSPASEIHGSMAGLYDYGYLGTLLKRNVEEMWRKYFLTLRPNSWELETSLLMPQKVFVASGHLENFNDPLAQCSKCGLKLKADQINESPNANHPIKCPRCGNLIDSVRPMNLMFEVKMGTTGSESAYLRPETAQGAYVSFHRQFKTLHERLPLSLGIIGKAFRNEISPRQGLLRLRELTQAELQIFFDPQEIDSEALLFPPEYKVAVKRPTENESFEVDAAYLSKELPKLYVNSMLSVYMFFTERLHIPGERVRLRELGSQEKAFYNKLHWDIEVNLESAGGYTECGGIHYRTDHDLQGHQNVAGKDLQILRNGRKFLPHVIELSLGVDRCVWSLLETNLLDEPQRKLLKISPALSPVKVAIFPLVSKDELIDIALRIYRDLSNTFVSVYDESGSIGRRYRRQDEIGTPYAVTVDHDTISDNSVTIRVRDDMTQTRLGIGQVKSWLSDHLDDRPHTEAVTTIR